MASEVENLVYVIEVQDKGSDAFKGILGNIGNLTDGIISSARKIAEVTWEGLKDTVKAYANFEEQLGGARRTMELNKEETKALGQALQEMAMNFEKGGLKAGATTATLAEIAAIAGQMNIKFTENQAGFEQFVTTIAKTSVAFEMSAEKAASALGILSNVYNIPIEKSDELAGAIATIGNSSVATVPQILDFMQRIGATGAALGLTANEAVALGGMVREAGLSVETAGTAISNIFTKMQTDLDKFAEVLAAGGLDKGMLEMAIRSKDAGGALEMVVKALAKIAETDPIKASEAMKDLGLQGSRSVAVLQSLIAQFPKYQGFLEQIQDPTKNVTALNEAYEASLQGLNRQWDATKNILTVLSQIVGENLSNAIGGLLEKYVNPFLLKFQEWLKNSPAAQAILTELGRTIDIIGAAVGKLAMGWLAWLTSLNETGAQKGIHEWFAKIQSSIENLITNFSKIDWGAVWKDLIGFLKDTISLVSGLSDGWKSASRWVVDFGQTVGFWLEGMYKSIMRGSEALGWFVDRAGAAFDAWLSGIARKIDDFGAAIERTFSGMIGWIDKVLSKIGDMTKAIGGGALDAFLKFGKEVFGDSVLPDTAMWAGIAASAVDTIGTAAKTVTQSMLATGEAASSMTSDVIAGASAQLAAWGKVQAQVAQTYQMAANNPAMRVDADALSQWQRLQAQQVFGQDVGSYIAAEGNAARIARQAQTQQQQAPVTQGWGTSGITVNFNGENIVDEQSLNNFVNKITRVQAETQATRI